MVMCVIHLSLYMQVFLIHKVLTLQVFCWFFHGRYIFHLDKYLIEYMYIFYEIYIHIGLV